MATIPPRPHQYITAEVSTAIAESESLSGWSYSRWEDNPCSTNHTVNLYILTRTRAQITSTGQPEKSQGKLQRLKGGKPNF